jgi:EpsI family protein
VGVFIAYYRAQGEGHKLVSSQNVLVKSNDPQWNQVESGSHALALAQRTLTVRTGRILGVPGVGEVERPRLLAWQLYWVNGTWTSSDYLAKLAGAWHRLRGQGDESAAVVVYAAEGAAGDAEGLLGTFVTANLGAIEAALLATRDGR